VDLLGVKSSTNSSTGTTEFTMMMRLTELLFMSESRAAGGGDDSDGENAATCNLEDPLQGEDDSEDDGANTN